MLEASGSKTANFDGLEAVGSGTSDPAIYCNTLECHYDAAAGDPAFVFG